MAAQNTSSSTITATLVCQVAVFIIGSRRATGPMTHPVHTLTSLPLDTLQYTSGTIICFGTGCRT